jgi:hypothetical protein
MVREASGEVVRGLGGESPGSIPTSYLDIHKRTDFTHVLCYLLCMYSIRNATCRFFVLLELGFFCFSPISSPLDSSGESNDYWDSPSHCTTRAEQRRRNTASKDSIANCRTGSA